MKHIQKKQAGITLVELLVAMLCATIAITMVVSTLLFLTSATDELIQAGSEGLRIQSIKAYILEQHHISNPSDEYVLNSEEHTLSHNGKIIARDTPILEITFSENGNFIYCELTLQGRSYRFVAGNTKGG